MRMYQNIAKGEEKAGVGRGSLLQVWLCTDLAVVMCKQLYWNWISTFTSGIHLEEHRAAEGSARLWQAALQQVPTLASAPLWSRPQEGRFGFWYLVIDIFLYYCCYLELQR